MDTLTTNQTFADVKNACIAILSSAKDTPLSLASAEIQHSLVGNSRHARDIVHATMPDRRLQSRRLVCQGMFLDTTEEGANWTRKEQNESTEKPVACRPMRKMTWTVLRIPEQPAAPTQQDPLSMHMG